MHAASIDAPQSIVWIVGIALAMIAGDALAL
jgi:hypothetical protein